MMSDEKLRILIIAEDRELNNLLRDSLESSNDFEVKSYFDGKGAFEEVEHYKPDLILLEMLLPHYNGIQILKQIRENSQTAEIFVVLLAAQSHEKDKIEAFEAGVDDYITKPFSAREILLRINALLRRANTLKIPSVTLTTAKPINIGPLKIYPEESKVTVNEEPVYLTMTEYQLLVFLAERVGKIQSREALLQKVWGYEGHVNTRTVDTHIKRLRQKLGSAGVLIETMHGFGYQMVAP